MKTLVVATWIMSITLSGMAQEPDETPSVFDNTIPVQLQKIVGSGAWLYMWAHDHLPLEPGGFTLKSAPVEFSKPNGGRTKSNWGKDFVYQSTDQRVTITARVLKHHPVAELKGRATIFAVPPQHYWQDPIDFTPFAFHKTLAASGVPSKTGPGRADYYLAFRLDDRLFMLEGQGREKGVDSKTAVQQFAERIHSKHKNSPQQPHYVPSGLLGYPLGTYLTIEGLARQTKGGIRVQVEAINDVPCNAEIHIHVPRIYVTQNTKCKIKGYETGGMVGVPPALIQLEPNNLNHRLQQATWHLWRSFVPTSIVYPKELSVQLSPEKKSQKEKEPTERAFRQQREADSTTKKNGQESNK